MDWMIYEWTNDEWRHAIVRDRLKSASGNDLNVKVKPLILI